MEQSFITLAKPCGGEITEKKSRFIASVSPVKTEAEALDFIAEIRKKHRDARHNCFAYILSDGDISRSSDDGEPSGSAGRPMAAVLAGKGLKDVCAVVTRYFGGTLLGVGGLVRAYSGALETALAGAETAVLTKCVPMTVTVGYNDIGKIKKLFEKVRQKQVSSEYGENVMLELLVEAACAAGLADNIKEETAGRAEIVLKGERYCELPERVL